ncbi:NAD(P)/FAD-dependent oxidoreductase [Fructobacillus sp. M2-14]|uniref:Ferredoxin--NADP reductase n=1 Tax=Fructobacillus broussonetiae TaxID=2713173 RepID=A0ABS5R111_9LACO|nr:NAD(P)/FAD-dependent oxidoreductase [Fructobacillus broussonetiae]MBS9339133.1 NAD(P)/FAD-dependent oxidoreductase [Fructobacillus broussonetiae]
MNKTYDILIVGAGPVGLFAGYYASLRNVKVAVLEALPEIGGQVTTLYPDKKIWDVPAMAGMTGRELIQRLEEQSKRFDLPVLTNHKVTNLEKVGDEFVVEVNGDETMLAKAVILASGKGAFSPRRLQVENEEELLGHGLAYFAPDLNAYDGREVAVLGGGDSAVDLANEIEKRAKKTTLIHRRDSFRALEQSVKELENSAVEKKTPYKVLSAVKTANGRLKLNLSLTKEKEVAESIEVDDLLVQYGFKTNGQAERDWKIDVDWDKAGLAVKNQMETKEPGLFAIGDLSSYEGHADLIATGFGQGPAAVNAAIAFYDPKQAGPGHSSSLNIE